MIAIRTGAYKRGAVTKATKMTTSETCHYRGYEILPCHLWSSWCVGVYRTRADLPLMSQSPLLACAPRKEDALGEARQSIDRILSEPSWGCTFYGQSATNGGDVQ